MKKNDLAAVVLIVAFAAVVSYLAANYFIGSPQTNPVQVEVISPISDSFQTPDSRIFNKNAIDPTVKIKGGSESSDKPFTN